MEWDWCKGKSAMGCEVGVEFGKVEGNVEGKLNECQLPGPEMPSFYGTGTNKTRFMTTVLSIFSYSETILSS